MFNKLKVKSLIDSNNDLSVGIYNGTVVDVSDPGFESKGTGPVGRVRIQIPGLTDDIPIAYLPWYLGKQSFSPSPNAKMIIPPVGSQVVVEFPTNDIYNGLYSYIVVSSPPTIEKKDGSSKTNS
ncbi:structural protein [Yersinia phage YerA41]|uniref:Structural protein n=1 Tax=Yersinia phage vB_Yru_GN1 TaxID=3074381 RepID=A0AA86IWT6_9CAUD|nr:structural protein [Yersinia phage YerA41]BES79817.1 structural protein [Yersinia phage vB_Yru_GN1]